MQSKSYKIVFEAIRAETLQGIYVDGSCLRIKNSCITNIYVSLVLVKHDDWITGVPRKLKIKSTV